MIIGLLSLSLSESYCVSVVTSSAYDQTDVIAKARQNNKNNVNNLVTTIFLLVIVLFVHVDYWFLVKKNKQFIMFKRPNQ